MSSSSSVCNGDNSNRRYYDLLGEARDAGADEIKRAFRRAAATHHPDKGGDEEAFKEVARAYQVLGDPDLRAVYDEYGEDGVNCAGAAAGGGASYDEAFDEFVETFRFLVAAGGGDRAFGDVVEMLKHLVAGGGGGGDKVFDDVVDMFHNIMAGGEDVTAAGTRAGDLVKFVDLSLEEFYNGTTKKFTVTRDVTCVNCDGEGNTLASPAVCAACNGAGYKVVASAGRKMMMMGFRRSGGSEPCAACGGRGEVGEGIQRCSVCRGRKVATEKKVIELVVDKGTPDGHRITFAGEGDVTENGVAGDVAMVLQQRNHTKFTRKGDDLFYDHELSLAEALCGFQFALTHLDGRRLLVNSGAGAGDEVAVRPGQLKAIDGEGMPVHGMPFSRGTLYVAFRVRFPDTVSPALRDAVAGAGAAAFSGERAADGGCDVTATMRDVDEDEEMKHGVKDERQREHAGAGGEDEYVHVHTEEGCAQQ